MAIERPDSGIKVRARAGIVMAVSACLVACATASETPRAARAPERRNHLQDVACRYVGLEDVSGPHDQNADAVTLVATYRFGDGAPPITKQPLALKFQVTRSRVAELRDYLAARPEVICSPEDDSTYAAHVEPFGDIRGEPLK